MDVREQLNKQIASDIGDCGAIASSALVLATDRSLDLNVPLMVTYIMLKKLCEKNIEEQQRTQLPPEAMQMAEIAGIDVTQVHKDAQEALETIIDEYFEWSMERKEIKR